MGNSTSTWQKYSVPSTSRLVFECCRRVLTMSCHKVALNIMHYTSSKLLPLLYISDWYILCLCSFDCQVSDQEVHRRLWSKHRWASARLSALRLCQTQPLQRKENPLLIRHSLSVHSSIHLNPLCLCRSALLQKGHSGRGGSVASDPGYTLCGTPGTSWKQRQQPRFAWIINRKVRSEHQNMIWKAKR